MKLSKLSPKDRDARLAKLADWQLTDEKLTRSFHFEGFVEAFGWMSSVALVAERMNHHPEWSNVYNRVEVALTTHDAGGITEEDFELAEAMDALSAKRE